MLTAQSLQGKNFYFSHCTSSDLFLFSEAKATMLCKITLRMKFFFLYIYIYSVFNKRESINKVVFLKQTLWICGTFVTFQSSESANL